MDNNNFERKKNTKNKIISFSFGKNWQNYLKILKKENLLIAKKSLIAFLEDVENKTFIDVGCGSGLFSYLMLTLDAKEIISIDVDPFSVECAKFLKNIAKNPSNWKICQGSILDRDFISQFGNYDIVYSWGVLHHTGKMWEAIRNTCSLVKDNGLLYIAIYNKGKMSKYWLKIKEFYNISPKLGKILMNFLYFFIWHFSMQLIQFKNPFKKINEYKKIRGMDPFIDIKDWLGGLPYEYATFEEVITFFKRFNSNFKLVKFYGKLDDKRYIGNNEFLFKKLK